MMNDIISTVPGLFQMPTVGTCTRCGIQCMVPPDVYGRIIPLSSYICRCGKVTPLTREKIERGSGEEKGDGRGEDGRD